jgi:hypothetical protein
MGYNCSKDNHFDNFNFDCALSLHLIQDVVLTQVFYSTQFSS